MCHGRERRVSALFGTGVCSVYCTTVMSCCTAVLELALVMRMFPRHVKGRGMSSTYDSISPRNCFCDCYNNTTSCR